MADRARFAAATTTTVERSQSELGALLRRHGAERHAFAAEPGRSVVMFELGGRRVRLEMTTPSADDFAAEANQDPPRGWRGWTPARRREWCEKQAEQVLRSRWRALVLVTKAKLELVAEGQSTVEREFMADLVLPNGARVEEWLSPQLATAYSKGKMPPLLPPAGGRRG